ncbi:hypothetical protein JHK87_029534 [Glycine soja]|nr:hypothetical protein JHK87_029534 [Glycine soja]
MPDLGNLSLSAALKHSHCSSSNALDAPVKTLTNGFVESECCFCCHFIYLGDDELLCSVRGCDTRYHSECAKEAVGPSTLKKFKCPQHGVNVRLFVSSDELGVVYFICKKKQFRKYFVDCLFHLSMKSLRLTSLGKTWTVRWSSHDHRLNLGYVIFVLKKWKYIKIPDLPFQVGDLAESRCFEKVVIVVHGLDASYQNNLLNIYRDRGKAASKGFNFRSEGAKCAWVGFWSAVGDVHPSLHGTQVEQSTNISNSTLEGLEQAILKLKTKGKLEFQKASAEVDRLAKLKASRMKELVFKKRSS